MKRRIVSVCFGLYIVLMLWLLFAQRIGQTAALYGSYWETLRWNLNWVPFRTIREMLELLRKGSGYLRRFAVINLGGNVGMFLPLGLFLPELWSGMRKFKNSL